MEEFIQLNRSLGKLVTRFVSSCCWVNYSVWRSKIRYPITYLSLPNSSELQYLFWRQWSSCLYFAVEPDSSNYPANAYLYICNDSEYDISKLSENTRKRIRRGLNRTVSRKITFEELRQHGLNTLNVTRQRHRFPAIKKVNFDHFCEVAKFYSCIEAWGSWVGDNLAAWITVMKVGDVWETYSSVSDPNFRTHYPSNALYYVFLKNKLVEEGNRAVSTGLSGFSEDSHGLEYFKESMGFNKILVHKCILLHPLVRPFLHTRFERIIRRIPRLAGKLSVIQLLKKTKL